MRRVGLTVAGALVLVTAARRLRTRRRSGVSLPRWVGPRTAWQRALGESGPCRRSTSSSRACTSIVCPAGPVVWSALEQLEGERLGLEHRGEGSR